MVEFKVQIEDSIVQTLGQQEIEQYLQEFTRNIVLKLAAQDILNELESLDLQNDKEWQLARQLSWEQEKHKYSA